jgi:hypothetical protein
MSHRSLFDSSLLVIRTKANVLRAELSRNCRVASFAILALFALSAPVGADSLPCPKVMTPIVEARLLPVLEATREAIRKNDWSDSAYETVLDELLDGKDDASIEARVALMDYPIATAYSEQLSCIVSTGGRKALYYLKLYSRCDIPPSRSPVQRDHTRKLRSITLDAWKAGQGKGSCDYE